jgi:hypothetical protein
MSREEQQPHANSGTEPLDDERSQPTSQEGAELLPEEDRAYLEGKAMKYQCRQDGGLVALILFDFALPSAYTPSTSDLLIRLPAGYPNAHPDMFWTHPEVRLASGDKPERTEARHDFLGRRWQRWSRHYRGAWRPGIDGIANYLGAIRSELQRGV